MLGYPKIGLSVKSLLLIDDIVKYLLWLDDIVKSFLWLDDDVKKIPFFEKLEMSLMGEGLWTEVMGLTY